MGLEIDRESFTPEDFHDFEERLEECLAALQQVLARPGFGHGPRTLGAEVELDLVDREGAPAPVNAEVLARARDPRLTLEVDRFNLEVNARPVGLEGAPFSALGHEIQTALARVTEAADACAARALHIGTLPSLTPQCLTREALTDRCRYRALSGSIRRLRRTPFPIHIQGEDTLQIDFDDVTLEGANTSLQIHLRVSPHEFATFHTAAQLATAPVLALSGNSPIFLGHRLWDETRVALFRQSVDDRPAATDDDWRPARVSFGHGWVRHGIHESFAESVGLYEPLLPVLTSERPLDVVAGGQVPQLEELRLHYGTVWQWNRGVYDPAQGGHVRLELRALPAGPTVVDMMANAAFLVGLLLAFVPEVPRLMNVMTFGHARRNFYQAARHGLNAQLLWLMAPNKRTRVFSSQELLPDLLDRAQQGLQDHGVVRQEAKRWLDVLRHRLDNGQTGARWQRQVFDALLAQGHAPAPAGRKLVNAYWERQQEGRPVHEWSLP